MRDARTTTIVLALALALTLALVLVAPLSATVAGGDTDRAAGPAGGGPAALVR
jgi:hypothetical protein